MFAQRVAFLCLVCGGSVLAQQAVVEPAAGTRPSGTPRLYCPNPVLDLGMITEGQEASGKFILQNQGDADLEILDVKASCGCTTVALGEDQRRIPPGGQVEIAAKFNSKGRQGEQKKYVTITTNDPENKAYRVTLQCMVESLINVRPSGVVNFRSARRGEDLEPTADLVPGAGATSLSITSINLTGEGIAFRQEPMTIDGREGVRLHFAVEEDAPLGRVNATLNIQGKAGDRDAPATVRLTGEVLGELRYAPNIVNTGRPVQRGQELQPIGIQSTAGRAFEILGVDAGPHVVAKVVEQKKNLSYNVTLSVSDTAPDGPSGSSVDIRTSVPDEPLIRVPVFVDVAPAVTVVPPIVLLKGSPLASPVARKVYLSTSRGVPFSVDAASSDQPVVKAELVGEADRPAPRQCVLVGLNGALPPGIHQAVVTVHTDVPGAEQVRIPVTILVTNAATAP